jgi:hypothetical protein
MKALRSRDESGQSLMIVLGLVTLIWLGTLVLASNVSAHFPIVDQDLLVHQAYRAMEAGIDSYESEANSNPDAVLCGTGATIKVVNQYPNPTSTTTSTPSLPSNLCSSITIGSWISVPNLGTTKGAPAWYLYGAPTVYYCTGGTSSCPSTAWVSLNVVGAAKGGTSVSYNPGSVTFQPSNQFLLNLYWLNYDQTDPNVIQPTPADCELYWTPSPAALQSGCQAVDFIGGETLNGNIFSNDPLFICDNSTYGDPTINGTLESADPSYAYTEDPSSGGGCTGGAIPTGTATIKDLPQEPIPTDDYVLATEAAQDGCLYEGPTEIQLARDTNLATTPGYSASNNEGYYMQVTSPDTPNSGTTSSPVDGLSSSGNSSTCLSGNGWVPYPANGVVFVENCTSGASCTTFNPLNNILFTDDTSKYPWNGPTSGPTLGDAIVQGTVKGPLTVAAQDNVVITGDLCYESWGSPSAGCPIPGTLTNPTPDITSGADVLGLIAYNYVIVNHPIDNPTTSQECTTSGATFGATTSNLDCDIPNLTIDSAILALNQQFFVNNWDNGSSMGTITVNGSIGEDWRGPVGTAGTDHGQPVQTGYSKDYTYDSRLAFLSPPLYLNPGTSEWSLGTISAKTGTCPSSISGCSTAP